MGIQEMLVVTANLRPSVLQSWGFHFKQMELPALQTAVRLIKS